MFLTKSRNKKVLMAVDMANLLMQNHMGFLKRLESLEQFDMTECDNEDIVSFMKDRYLNSIQEVKTKRYWNPFSKAIASYNPKYPNTITLNSRRLGRTVDSIVGTILHEAVHLTDHYYQSVSFGHGDNSPIGKENTAPFKIGEVAKQHCIEHID